MTDKVQGSIPGKSGSIHDSAFFHMVTVIQYFQLVLYYLKSKTKTLFTILYLIVVTSDFASVAKSPQKTYSNKLE